VTSTCPSDATKLGAIACLDESPQAVKRDTSTAKAMRFFMDIPYRMFKLLYLNENAKVSNITSFVVILKNILSHQSEKS
jgi:hypothetical protein